MDYNITTKERRTISVITTNEASVLSRISGLFSNIVTQSKIRSPKSHEF